MKNPYKIDARKRYAKMMKNERKWSPNGSQNPLKINKIEKKRGPKIDAKKGSDFPRSPGNPWRQVNYLKVV